VLPARLTDDMIREPWSSCRAASLTNAHEIKAHASDSTCPHFTTRLQQYLQADGSYLCVERTALERELHHRVGRSSVLSLGLMRDVEENVFERADAEVKRAAWAALVQSLVSKSLVIIIYYSN
jgi:hypothetical protein